MTDIVLPLKGLIVLEFCQYLSGPSAGLRLADLGARVIKIEHPEKGEAGRKLSIKNLWVGSDSLLFHTINRNKESFTADLKNAEELQIVKQLITKADVLIHNFRPGVMEKIGLDYSTVKQINPSLIYAEISGYGKAGAWQSKPGQDLLLQSITGLAYASGDQGDAPVPCGVSIGDNLCGAQLVQGILAALIRRQKTGQGALVETSLMESLLDFQFELLTTYFASKQQPVRSKVSNANPLLSAPYGVYATQDGYIAIAMMNLAQLATAIDCHVLNNYSQNDAFAKRDEIKEVIAQHIAGNVSSHWLEKLHAAGLWSMEIMDWQQLSTHEGYLCLEIEQTINVPGADITTTRCPIKIDGNRIYSGTPAPLLGEHNQKIHEEILREHAFTQPKL